MYALRSSLYLSVFATNPPSLLDGYQQQRDWKQRFVSISYSKRRSDPLQLLLMVVIVLIHTYTHTHTRTQPHARTHKSGSGASEEIGSSNPSQRERQERNNKLLTLSLLMRKLLKYPAIDRSILSIVATVCIWLFYCDFACPPKPRSARNRDTPNYKLFNQNLCLASCAPINYTGKFTSFLLNCVYLWMDVSKCACVRCVHSHYQSVHIVQDDGVENEGSWSISIRFLKNKMKLCSNHKKGNPCFSLANWVSLNG